jgi:phosphomannomutase
VTSNSALEASGAFGTVIRTKVGSPYVIEGMADAVRSGSRTVVGFEANGGVLLGTAARAGDRELTALPTRDAVLPILCALGDVAATGRGLAAIAAGFAFKAAASNRLKNVATDRCKAFIGRLEQDRSSLDELLAPLGDVVAVDMRDGLRITVEGGEVVHFRASGNAPELRVYVEAATQDRAEELLGWGLDAANQRVA